MKASKTTLPFEHKRDAYGFTVRPQHLQRYREYASIYKEEEEERSDRWKYFLENQDESSAVPINPPSEDKECTVPTVDASVQETEAISEECLVEDHPTDQKSVSSDSNEEDVQLNKEIKIDNPRPSLGAIEHMMSFRVKKRKNVAKDDQEGRNGNRLAPIEEGKVPKGTSEEESDDEFYDVERTDPVQEVGEGITSEPYFPWKEELECLVRGGVPMALRGELWQTFAGVKTRRVERYYQDLLDRETVITDDSKDANSCEETSSRSRCAPEKWKGQIEKDLPRTFPGHPALDEDGRNALRRLLTAYARHNPSVGYCQAMNFFAGLLLLLMPEENAFWTLTGIMDDYFEGYYTEEMTESQVDQLAFEDLVRERFPKLVNHLDYLGVQVTWVTGPWFLSIFVNMLPWESVLRVWDVLLFEGNRVMLFRTALALMELYGPALVTTKDAGDAVTLLQTLAGSTFDSSQLVLTASMGYQVINEARLQELRDKYRPSVLMIIEERSKGIHVWKDPKGLASKLYSFKHDSASLISDTKTGDRVADVQRNAPLDSGSNNLEDFLTSLSEDAEVDSLPDLQEQVLWLKGELCTMLEEKRSAILRAEELETALMEMVQHDNRRQLSARVEMLEQELAELRQALTDKQEQEHAMIQVLMRVEQEQKVTEDARMCAEQDAAAQRYATNVLQEKYEEAIASLAQMEKRVVMAESMLEATLQYQSGQIKVQPSPRSAQPEKANHESAQEIPARKIGLLSIPFGMGWRDKNKGKPSVAEESNDSKPSNVGNGSISTQDNNMNGHHE